MRRLATILTLATLAVLALAPAAQAEFGLLPGPEGFDGSFTEQDGSPATQAGSRPFAITTSLRFATTTNKEGKAVPDGTVKDVLVDLPPGVSGDFTKLPHCTGTQLNAMLGGSKSSERCPIDAQVGVLTAYLNGGVFHGPIYNMVPPPDTPADFGVPVIAETVYLTPSVRTGTDYGIRVSSLDTSSLEPLFGADASFWGVPSDPSHDTERFPCMDPYKGPSGNLCPVTFPPFPLFTLPTACAGPLTTAIRVNSWQQPDEYATASFQTHDGAANPYGLHGCALLGFAPSITARPDTTAADTPTGLHFDLHQPQNDNPDGFATAQLKTARVTLPTGLLVNPSGAAGLEACTEAEAGYKPGTSEPFEFSPAPAACPPASKLGTVRVHTPLVADPVEGAIFLATPYQNPFGSLLAVYLSVDDPTTGVIVKLSSAIEIDEATGRLTLAFDQIPQFPIEDTEVSMFGGPRAALRTAPLCGSYVTTSDLTPWTTPYEPDAHPSDPFAIDSGPGGGACANTAAQLPHDPSFAAGTQIPLAASYSPFVLRLGREDGSQALRGIDFTLPPGLTGKLAGIAQCSEASIEAARARSGPHGGTEELERPSCPAGSRIGQVRAYAGAGPLPVGVTGSVYLAGPYRGAPLSVVVITPAVSGPVDLGAVVVRSALQVDPATAQVHAVSESIPTILKGIPVDLRSVAVELDRSQFMLNPTSCEPMSIGSQITSDQGAVASPSVRFQVGGCRGLGFKPSLSLKLKGGTKRGALPALRAVLKARPGDANIAGAQVALPHSEFLEQGHLNNICTRVQFAAHQCPPASIYGHAVAKTPLFDQPLEGPVYLRSSSHELPDLVAALKGPPSEPVEVDLDGRVDSIHGGIRTTFEVVPDAPVTKFTLSMQGGRKGLIVNSTNLCSGTHRATAKFGGQNGKRATLHPALKSSCKRAPHRKHRRGHRRR